MQQIDEILALTDQVQQFIDDGRWAEAGLLEKKRMQLLSQLFARDDLAAIGPDCEQLVRDLLARNANMAETVMASRGNLEKTTQRINAATKAVGAYRRNEPNPGWGEARLPAPTLQD